MAFRSDSSMLQTMDNSVHRQRVQWKPAEELMLKMRIQSNTYFVTNLAPLTPSSKPLILKDKKLWQRLADEHNAELCSKGLSCLKPRTSKSIRDKWRYKVSTEAKARHVLSEDFLTNIARVGSVPFYRQHFVFGFCVSNVA